MASIKDKEASLLVDKTCDRPMGSFKAATMMHLPSSQLLLLDNLLCDLASRSCACHSKATERVTGYRMVATPS